MLCLFFRAVFGGNSKLDIKPFLLKMSNTRYANFRNFLTERFTAVAVEVFEEVGNILEEYREENKRLRRIIQTTLDPTIKLTRIDPVINQYNGTATAVSEDQVLYEPVLKQCKEEEDECDIGFGAQQKTFTQPDNVCMEDIKVVVIGEADVETTSTYTTTTSSEETTSGKSEDSLSDASSAVSKESSSATMKMKKKMKKKQKTNCTPTSLQKTMLEWPMEMPRKANLTSGDYQSFHSRLTDVYKDFRENEKPLITKMALSANVELVDTAFGKVPKDSTLFFHCLTPSSSSHDALPRPPLPLSHHTLQQTTAATILHPRELDILNEMRITWEGAHHLEQVTCKHKESVNKMRKMRLMNHFKEMCNLKPWQSYVTQLISKIKKGIKKQEEMEEEMKGRAVREYCRRLCVKWHNCGLIVHPDAPWLGAAPDGLMYDASEAESFGLVSFKYINLPSFVECSLLVFQNKGWQLKTASASYWQIQAEMMIAGVSWCDLLVLSREDLLVQRIYRDSSFINLMKSKLDDFFYSYYLPALSMDT